MSERWTLAVASAPDYNPGDRTPGYKPLVVSGPKMQRGEIVEVMPAASMTACARPPGRSSTTGMATRRTRTSTP